MSENDIDDTTVISGGIMNGFRELNHPLEKRIQRLFQERVKFSREFGQRLWSTLTNTTLVHPRLGKVCFTYRAAGDIVAALREEGHYLDWYCRSPSGKIDPEIANELQSYNWVIKRE